MQMMSAQLTALAQVTKMTPTEIRGPTVPVVAVGIGMVVVESIRCTVALVPGIYCCLDPEQPFCEHRSL